MKRMKSTQAETLNTVMQYLRTHETSTVPSCAAALRLPRTSVWRAFSALHKLRLIHVISHGRGGCDRAANVYRWGDGVDAVENAPPPMIVSHEFIEVPFVTYPIWHDRVFAQGVMK
jgi:hypothetical protein